MDNKKQGFFILVILSGALVFYLAVRFLSFNDEARLRQIIYAATLAVEQENILKGASFISESYEDKSKNKKQDIVKIAEGIFKKFDDIKIDIRLKTVGLEKRESQVVVLYKCYFKELKRDKNFSDQGKLKVHFIKENAGWRIKSFEYSGFQEIMLWQGTA
jgi:hypothetical protein